MDRTKMAETLAKILKVKFVSFLAIVFLILFVGLKLRVYSYSQVPLPGETNDEYAFGWSGISLLRDGYPTAWSGMPGYKSYDYQKINVDHIYDIHPEWPLFAINSPWFDHPPLFGLITGGYAYFKGVREFKDASVAILRRPMLYIATLSILLVIILGSKLYNKKVGLLSGILYATVPSIVISSRLVLAENGYIPLFLTAAIFIIYYLETRKKYFWYFVIVSAGLAILFKLSAISIFIFLFLVILAYGKQDRKFLIKSTIASLAIFILFFILYGIRYDIRTFLNVQFVNPNRFYGAGAEVLYNAVVQSKITGAKSLTDGWIPLGWISFFVLALHKQGKKDLVLVFSVISYLIVFLIFGGESYGWYRFPFYPFLIISSAKVIYDIIVSPNVIFVPLALMPFGTSVHRLVGTEGFQDFVFKFRFLGLALFGILLLGNFVKSNVLLHIQRTIIIIVLLFLIWLSVKEVFYYSVDRWYFVT